MKTIKKQVFSTIVVFAIVKAEDYFKEAFEQNKMIHSIQREDFVVSKWFDYKGYEGKTMEGITTIAICKHLEDAELIFKKYCKTYLKKK